MKINIYSDGACRSNGSSINIGAWSYLILYPDNVLKDDAECCINTTNNKMELTAIQKALESIDKELITKSDIIIYSDSNYAINCLSTWYYGWKSKGWKKSDGSDINNLDIIRSTHELLELAKSFKFIKVKGHSGDSYNEYVDHNCNKSMDDYLRKLNQ